MLKPFFLFLILVCFSFPAVFAQSRQKPNSTAAQESNEQQAAAFFEKGQTAHASGKLEEAIGFYTQALKLDSSLWQAEYQSAAAYLSLKRFPEAKNSIKKVLEQFKEFSASPELKQMQAKAEILLGEIALRTAAPEDAEAAYRRALELSPDNKSAHVGLAQIYIDQNKLTEAIAESKAAIAAGEDGALLYALLGNAQFRSNQTEAALTSLNEALKREPENRQALRDRAEVFLARKETDRAITDLKKLADAEKSAAAFLRLATIYRLAKQYDEAIKAYQQAADIEPTNQEVKIALAEVMIESGKAENAVAQLESLIKAEPSRADLRSQLAVLLVVGQPEKALEQYQIASKLEPGNPNHILGIGTALIKLKRFDESIAVLKPLSTQSLMEDQAYTARANLATAFFELKDYPNAAREYIWMLNYLARRGEQKKTALTSYLLGVCLDRIGDYEQALKAYQQFLSLAKPDQQLEIDKVKLRLPSLQRQIAQGQGIKNKKK